MTKDANFDLTPYKQIIEQMLTNVGLNPEECYVEDGEYWTATKGSAPIYIGFFNINYDDGSVDWYMYISAFIMAIPETKREQFYERLLSEAASRIATKFYINENEAWVEISRELDGLDLEEAVRNMHRVADTADELDDILISEFGS